MLDTLTVTAWFSDLFIHLSVIKMNLLNIELNRFNGPEWVKEAKGDLIRSQCDLLAIINAFNIDNYYNIPTIVVELCLISVYTVIWPVLIMFQVAVHQIYYYNLPFNRYLYLLPIWKDLKLLNYLEIFFRPITACLKLRVLLNEGTQGNL